MINYEGRPADMVFISDISERIKIEDELKQYKFIIEQSSQEIGIAELDGTILYVNEAMAGDHGYKQDELVGKKIPIFHPQEEMKKVNEDLRILMEKGITDMRLARGAARRGCAPRSARGGNKLHFQHHIGQPGSRRGQRPMRHQEYDKRGQRRTEDSVGESLRDAARAGFHRDTFEHSTKSLS